MTLTRDASMHPVCGTARRYLSDLILLLFCHFQVLWARRPPALDRGAQVPRYLQILADFSRCFADGLKMCKDFPRFHDGNSLGRLDQAGVKSYMVTWGSTGVRVTLRAEGRRVLAPSHRPLRASHCLHRGYKRASPPTPEGAPSERSGGTKRWLDRPGCQRARRARRVRRTRRAWRARWARRGPRHA